MKKTTLFLMLAAFASPAFAEDLTADSKITAVTVFPDRADVSRTAGMTIPAGKHTIVFNDLPAGLLTDSLRVSGQGSGTFSIGSVETKEFYTADLAVADEKKIQDKILALRDKRRFIEAEIKAADTGKAFLENLTKDSLPAPVNPPAQKQTVSPDSWQNAWQTIQKGMNTLGRESIEKQITLRTIDSDISALQQELRSIATGRRSYKQVRVNVETSKPVKADMTLQYQIRGASWNPLYEARLDSSVQTVKIVQYGNISQRTGEDWTNAALTLSTAVPSVDMTPPALNPVWLNLREEMPVFGAVKSRSVQKLAAATNFAMKADMAVMESAAYNTGGGIETEDAVYDTAAAVGTEFSGVFVIKGLSNVPSDGTDHRFNIGDYAAQAEIRAETVPAQDASAYLIATLVYGGELPLLPGNIALFRDRAFIGNSFLELLRPNEKLHLSFGQDDKIRVKYTSLGGKTSEGGVISRETKKDFLSVTEVQNLHKQPIKIAVFDLLPVARNSDISVKVIKDKTTPDYELAPNNKVGSIRWESIYQPQEKKKIDFGYSVSYPKDKVLTGL